MSEIDDSMYRLTVEQRDAAWREAEYWRERHDALLKMLAKQASMYANPPVMMAVHDESFEAGRIKGAADESAAKDAAYKERNQLVALLSTLFPAGKARTAIEGWSEDWHGCVYIDFPWGQASWHYHDSDAWMFEHLPPYQGRWDGHTTEQKYKAIAMAVGAGCWRAKPEDDWK